MINNPYVPGVPYAYDLEWQVAEILRLKSQGASYAAELKALRAYIDALYNNPNYPIGDIQRVLKKMYQEGLFDILLENIISDYSYNQPDLISEYATLDEIIAELDTLADSSEWISSSTVATSIAGEPIKMYIVGKPGINGVVYRRGLVIGNQHAREYQSTYLIANAIKMLIHNLDQGTGSINQKNIIDMFTGYQVYFIPTGNPDGYKLTAEDNYSDLPLNIQANISQWVEAYIREGRIDTTQWSDFSPTEYNELLEAFNNDLTTYTFRREDIKRVFKSNLAGVDLHYNSWNSANEYITKQIAEDNNYPTSPAVSDYIGEAGFNQPENAFIPNLIASNGIHSIYNIHQRGPTCFYAYSYGGRKLDRANVIVKNIAAATGTPINHGNNAQVGFAGWFHANYNGQEDFCCIKEVGWGSEDNLINGASIPASVNPAGVITNPLPRSLSQKVYFYEINGILEFISSAVNNLIINTPQNVSYNKDNVYIINSTSLSLKELCQEYNDRASEYPSTSVAGMNTIIIPNPSDENTPNILLPGVSGGYKKIIISQVGAFSIAKCYDTYGNAWESIITSSKSTPWRMTTPYGKRRYSTATTAGNTFDVVDDNNNPIIFRFEPIISLATENADVIAFATRTQAEGGYKFTITAKAGTAAVSTGIYWSITSKEYPSE